MHKSKLAGCTLSLLSLFVIASGCAADDPPEERLLANPEAADPLARAAPAPGSTVAQVARAYCSTAPVRRLSEQLIAEIECLRPGTMSRLDDLPGVELEDNAFPFLQSAARQALGRAARTDSLDVTSALRTTAQQYVLYDWYVTGRCTQIVSLAAAPGTSNHESGLAVDLAQAGDVRGSMSAQGFVWHGGSDPVHYDYVEGGVDLRPFAVRAFQRLWNRNHPEAPIAEDGVYVVGGETDAALGRAPAAGFPIGPDCAAPAPAARLAIEVYWARGASGRYELRALAPAEVTRVEYKVDGYPIGSASRADGSNFPTSYAFSSEGTGRFFEVDGYDATGQRVGRGIGLIDVGAGTAVYVRQMGTRKYEIGLERADAGVAAIEVRVDGVRLTDGVSGTTRSTRLAVRSDFAQLGARRFEVRTFAADGTLRGTLERTLTLE